MLAYFDKYCWTHGCGSHKIGNCNSKAPGYKHKTTIESNLDKGNYGFTEWQCWKLTRAATNNNRDILFNSTDSTSVPTKLNSYNNALLTESTEIIDLKSDTGATGNYIRGKDTIILKNPNPTTTSTRVLLPGNSIIHPTISVRLPLPDLLSAATQAHIYTYIKSASLVSIVQLWDYDCSAIFTKRTSIFSTQTTLLYSTEYGIHIMAFGM